ncbi:MAG: isoprenylcysteine carboxylmethyltransferase family protein [Candidatus Eisenbacteria bacterium]
MHAPLERGERIRQHDIPQPQPGSSTAPLWITITLAMWGAVWAARLFPAAMFTRPRLGQFVALALFCSGISLRWWAVMTLGRFFTVDVAIHSDHRVVTAGPYRFVGHPSYTGLILLFAAQAVAFENFAALIVALAPILMALGDRIRVEERALNSALGAACAEYRRTTKALIPGVF